MRIAFVTTSYPAREGDPAGHFVRAEARARAREGHEVIVIAPLAMSPDVRDGVRVIALGGGSAFGWPGVAARLRASPLRVVEAAAWVFRARAALAALEHEGALDRVIAHWCVPSAWPVASSARAPVEVVSHGADVRLLCAMPSRVRHAMVRRVLRRAHAWRFVSASLARDLADALGSKERAAVAAIARIEASPLEMPSIDVVRAAAAPRRATFGGLAAYAAVGRLTADKRVDLIVARVAKSADASRGTTAGPVLVVVGDGPERTRLEAMARTAGIDARFVGAVDRDEALAWMVAAGTLLFASEREGLSTVLREADALGVAVEIIGAGAGATSPSR